MNSIFHQAMNKNYTKAKTLRTNKAVVAKATYNNETVDVIDCIALCNNTVKYLINYGGPIWVEETWLSNIVWID